MSSFVQYHQARLKELDLNAIFNRFGAETSEHILERGSALACVRHLAEKGVLVSSLTFWCDCTPENSRLYGCPHGGGGYNHGRNGFYSECYHLESYDLEDEGFSLRVEPDQYSRLVDEGNNRMIHYLEHATFPSPCLCVVLGFP